MATKGLFGYSRDRTTFQPVARGSSLGGAQTFGNPDGAVSGGGAYAKGGDSPNGPNQGGGGGPPSPWTPTFVDTHGTGGISAMVVLDANRVVASTVDASIVYSADAGESWTFLPNPLGWDDVLSLASNATGTVVLMMGDLGGAPQIGRSSDGGQTWSMTTPPSFDGQQPVAYQNPRFVVFDATTAEAWTTINGVAWSTVALAAVFVPGSNSTRSDGFVTNGARAVWVGGDIFNADGQSVTTTAGTTFVESTVSQVQKLNTVTWDGTEFAAMGPNGGGGTFCVTSTNGIAAWGVASSSFSSNDPPYQRLFVTAIPGVGILNGVANDGLMVARSTDQGATWTPVTPTSSLTFTDNLTSDGTRAYILGDGIVSTTDLVTFTQELSVPGGEVDASVAGSGLVFAWGLNSTGTPTIWKRH